MITSGDSLSISSHQVRDLVNEYI